MEHVGNIYLNYYDVLYVHFVGGQWPLTGEISTFRRFDGCRRRRWYPVWVVFDILPLVGE